MSSYVGGTHTLPPVLSPGGSYPRSLSPGMIPPAMIESRGMPETRRFLHARAGPRSGPDTKAKPVMAAACSDDGQLRLLGRSLNRSSTHNHHLSTRLPLQYLCTLM